MPWCPVRDPGSATDQCAASTQQEVWDLGKEVIGMLKAQPPPRVYGVARAAFLIYYGEVNQDSDGPVEFCWPVPQDLADRRRQRAPGACELIASRLA
jgi:hypothetical protein